MTTTTATIYRMTCSTRPGAAHRTLYRLPRGAEIRHGLFSWIWTEDLGMVRCLEDGCRRAMRAVSIVDSHRGLGERTRCGDRCVSAIGPACDCECRGDNHGSGRW